MKFYTIFFILLPLVSFGQNSTFTSVFQLVDKKDSTEIYHVKLEVSVSKGFVSVSRFEEQRKIVAFTIETNFQTTDNNIYTDIDPKGNITTFNLKEQTVSIKNPYLTYTLYGKIPAVIKTN